MKRERVAVGELVDVSKLGRAGAPPTKGDLRAALPKGWVLEDDGEHAVRDRRWIFGQGWVLIVAMVVFGGLAIAIYASALPKGWGGIARVAVLLALLLVIGGVIAPLVTRALHRK